MELQIKQYLPNVFHGERISKARESYGDIVMFAQMPCTVKHIYAYASVTNKVVCKRVLKYFGIYF